MPRGHFIILILLLGPFIGRSSGEHNVTGEINGQVELKSCHGDGQNVQRVEWAKYRSSAPRKLLYTFEKPNNTTCIYNCQNILFLTQNMSLTLFNLSLEDEGIYEENIFIVNGSVYHCNITLSLLLPPPAILHLSVFTRHCALTLRCEASGELLNVRWLRDGQPLADDQRISFSERNLTMRVSTLNNSDFGTYTCEVSNAVGTSEAHVNVTGDNAKVCQENTDTTNIPQEQVLYFSGAALIIILVLCTIIISICCRRTHPTDRSRDAVYDEPSNLPVESDTPRVEPLPYVYTDYIKRKVQQATDKQHPSEDFGYSTIAEYQMQPFQSPS